ncbi:hypothetical protein Vspart_03499 [Vibrio spartinae]|uniref:Uncharacterized protein n=1 Tax=Vibrio spartinae TaxID=1918945 RepID=A0A1N6M205_9VIBR|nr:hypothetical protein Vspart_03499 [Vibrio spartinae]SIO93442.1 hypothetical protein VSP9026_01109 [Vibrio spartinae]
MLKSILFGSYAKGDFNYGVQNENNRNVRWDELGINRQLL